MSDPQKRAVLAQLYHLHEQYILTIAVACGKYCHDCCTANVTMTSLEGDYILSGLAIEDFAEIMPLIHRQLQKPRFIPALTTNQIAQACRNGEELVDEQSPADPGPCPLLHEGLCRIYPVRPFGCRCMVSSAPCRWKGWAETDPVTLTINTLFLQVIEHIDRDGFSGNLSDVLAWLDAKRDPDSPRPPVSDLAFNTPIPALIIPPEHRDRVMPIITAIRALSV
jgi:Fe-S-cluster containining protein